ncbi:MAG: response regulator [Rhodospirillales bacterium]|nr:response regulator [Rhodospirillales bacterium]
MFTAKEEIEISGALGLLAASVLDAVVAIDGDGIVVAWNPTAERTFGWTPDEAIGRSMGELIVPPQHRQSHSQGMVRYQQTGEARVLNRRIEIAAIDKSGREFPIELSIVPMSADSPAVFVGFLRDISQRRQAEERLTLSEESLRLTTEAAEIGIWDLDLDTKVLTWSDRTKAMFGISPEVLCSMDDFYAGLHPDDWAATRKAFAEALDPAVRATYDVEYRTIGKEDGIVRWVAAKGRGLFSDSGRCFRAVGTAIDISARKLADARHAFMLELSDLLRDGDPDEALSDACALMGRYFGVTRVGYGQLDPTENVFDYTICWTDGLVQPLLGRYPAPAFGTKIVAELRRGETVVVGDLLSDPLSNEEKTRNIATTVDVRAILVVPFVRAGKLKTIVYLNDRWPRLWRPDEIAFMEEVAERTRQVYERGEAEAALRTLNATLEARVEERTSQLQAAEDALRQAQKMEAIGQLTGGIAHDFNNLLQGITGSLELVQKRISQGRYNELERFVSSAMTSANRAAALTHRLLAFARRQPLDPRAVRANPLLASMADLLRRTLGERIDLELVLNDELWLTRCDPNQLESTVLNLAINARDAMPNGGKLVIETSNIHRDTGNIGTQHALHPGHFICITVSDTGIGMSQETVAKAFEPFFTTKPIGQGTGLGLSMIYGFARQSDGDATICSGLGKGTSVKLYLPRFRGEAEDDITVSGAAPDSAAETGETILVVEDESVVRALIVDALSDLGYQVVEAADGPSGLELLRSQRSIDLLITDIGLPGLGGCQVADAGRELHPALKVLFMTGYAETAIVASGFLQPDMAMITKPFAIEALATRVRELIGPG